MVRHAPSSTTGLIDSVTLRSLCVPHAEIASVRTGPLDADQLADMRASGFDDVPVVDDAGHYVGIATRENLEQLSDGGGTLSAGHAAIDRDARLRADDAVPLTELLQALRQSRALLVVTGHVGATPVPATALVGLMTVSDLNRHSLRRLLYDVFALLEADLASALEAKYSNEWDWLKHLSEREQSRILGHHALLRRQGLDIGAVVATTLANLLEIAKREPGLLPGPRGKSGKQFEGEVRSITKARNAVMHAVRPLVAKADDVDELHRAVSAALALRARLTGAAR